MNSDNILEVGLNIQASADNSKIIILNNPDILVSNDINKNFKVLKSLKNQLQITLDSLTYLKHRVRDKIISENAKTTKNLKDKNSEIKSVLNNEYEATGNCMLDQKVSTSEDQITNAPEQGSKDVSENSSSGAFNERLTGNELFNQSVTKTEPVEIKQEIFIQPSDNRDNCHEKVMISLISDDESDSECTIMSITGGTEIENIHDSSITSDDHSVNKVGISATPLQNLQSEEVNNLSGISEVGIHKHYKSKKRKSSENLPEIVKKNKISEADCTVSDHSQNYDFFGIFYKVKLSNLHSRISYADIMLLLRNAGLEYTDILLTHDPHRSSAEVSFTDLASKEKAVSLDRALMYSGMKIKIKSLEK